MYSLVSIFLGFDMREIDMAAPSDFNIQNKLTNQEMEKFGAPVTNTDLEVCLSRTTKGGFYFFLWRIYCPEGG